MTSSDSGEDFESADEDFDCLSKPEIDHNGDRTIEIEENKTSVQPRDPDNVLTTSNQSVDDSKPSIEQEKATITTFEASSLMEKTDESKVRQPSRKLGTKISNPDNVLSTIDQCVDDGKSSIEQERTTTTYEGPSLKEKDEESQVRQPSTKLGKKISNFIDKESSLPTDQNEELNIPERQIDACDVRNNKPCLEEEHNKDKSPLTSFSADCLKAINTTNETNLDQSSPGDGWEIEEDGFEIPGTLGKLTDRNMFQEPVFELDQVEFRPSTGQKTDGWSGWGTWGVSSILSTATDSVSTFSNQVTAGLSTMIETTVGAPNPENLASTINHKPNEEPKATSCEESTPVEENKTNTNFGGLGSIVSGVSFLGSTVINRGLDTLETLGKKTMEVLQDGDPHLLKKRAMLFPNEDKPVLSQILREAKDKADHSDKEKEEKEIARKVHFESLFDDFQGMVHLEALEMLSTQCELKLQSLLLAQSGPQLAELQETLSQVRDLCELADDEEDSEVLNQEQFAEQVTKCIKGLKINITAAKIIKVNDAISDRLSSLSTETATVVNQTAISSLAEFTAAGMECFHKSAELLLAKSIRSTPDEAESYVELISHLCARVSAVANEFTQLLTKHHPIANSLLITNIFLEASNCCSYIRNSCQLLIPILQVGTVSS